MIQTETESEVTRTDPHCKMLLILHFFYGIFRLCFKELFAINLFRDFKFLGLLTQLVISFTLKIVNLFQ